MTVPLLICINLLGLVISICHPYTLAKVSHKCMDQVKEKVPQQCVYPSKHANRLGTKCYIVYSVYKLKALK